jgi:hypothetical protein
VVADWHIAAGDKAWLRTQLDVLASRQRRIDDMIRDAADRQRFSKDREDIERAREDERRYLKALDAVMTAMRAIEVKLMLMPLDA